MRKFGLIVLSVIVAAAVSQAGQPLTLLFFNDFHAHLEPFELKGEENEVGGIARLAAIADGIRAANAEADTPTFLLVAGDVLQGTPYSTVYRGEAEFACLNEMGVAAMCPGNHEFDYGQDNLRRLTTMADFPVISANVAYDEAHGGGPFAAGYTWLEAGDLRVLVIGVTTPDTPVTTAPANVAGLTFGEPAAAAENVIAEFGEGADAVVALTHIGFENDVALARAVPALNVIIGGHSHTKVTAPEMVGKTAVGSAYEYGEFLGRMDLDVGGNGRVAVTAYELIPVTAESPESEKVSAVIAGYERGLSAKLAEVVGNIDVRLSYKEARGAETNFGDYIADLMREAVDADVALINAGAVRGDLGPGEITVGDVMTALPFGNEVVVLDVPGAALRGALALSAGVKVGDGGFLQVSGCGYTVAAGEGLKAAMVAGRPLDDAAVYRVAMPDFMATGGDGYAMFVGVSDVYKTGLLVYDLVITALREGRPVPAEPAARIKFINE